MNESILLAKCPLRKPIESRTTTVRTNVMKNHLCAGRDEKNLQDATSRRHDDNTRVEIIVSFPFWPRIRGYCI